MSVDVAATRAAPSLKETGNKASGRRLQSGHAFANRAELLVARDAWCANPTAAAATYGAIGTWDTSRIRDLSWVFCARSDPDWYSSGCNAYSRNAACIGCNAACANFNDDISGWDVSNVEGLWVRATSRLATLAPCL